MLVRIACSVGGCCRSKWGLKQLTACEETRVPWEERQCGGCRIAELFTRKCVWKERWSPLCSVKGRYAKLPRRRDVISKTEWVDFLGYVRESAQSIECVTLPHKTYFPQSKEEVALLFWPWHPCPPHILYTGSASNSHCVSLPQLFLHMSSQYAL